MNADWLLLIQWVALLVVVISRRKKQDEFFLFAAAVGIAAGIAFLVVTL